jgi:nicotinate-nucleotide pyrophosphorylase
VAIPVCSVEWHIAEGDEFEPVKHIATVCGNARYLLLGDRVDLIYSLGAAELLLRVFERSFRREY